MVIVILSGGSGTRLWPASREHKPKQFLKLFGHESLIVQTARRALAAHADQLLVVTNGDQAGLAQAELEEAGIHAEIVIEPARRNTGPAIALVAAQLAARGVTEPIAFLPADHFIPDPERFASCLARAARSAAQSDRLVVVGKRPERPETGYGYIERGEPLADAIFEVRRFVEKPNHETALAYLADGHYWWNTGLVVARAEVILEELRNHEPAMAAAVLAAVGAPARYHDAPNLSFDYAVLEKSNRVAVVEASFGWSDVGSWASWAEQSAANQGNTGNACNAGARVLALGSANNAVWSEKSVVLQDVEDLIVIDTAEVLYVTHKKSADKTAAARKAAIEFNESLR